MPSGTLARAELSKRSVTCSHLKLRGVQHFIDSIDTHHIIWWYAEWYTYTNDQIRWRNRLKMFKLTVTLMRICTDSFANCNKEVAFLSATVVHLDAYVLDSSINTSRKWEACGSGTWLMHHFQRDVEGRFVSTAWCFVSCKPVAKIRQKWIIP